MRCFNLFVVHHCDVNAANVELVESNIVGKCRGGIFHKNRVTYGSSNKVTVKFVRLFKHCMCDLTFWRRIFFFFKF